MPVEIIETEKSTPMRMVKNENNIEDHENNENYVNIDNDEDKEENHLDRYNNRDSETMRMMTKMMMIGKNNTKLKNSINLCNKSRKKLKKLALLLSESQIIFTIV